jgi:Ca-activated chloride channel family protein
MNRKTAGILGAAGGIAILAAFLGTRESRSSTRPPVPVVPEPPIASTCGTAPARASADFGPGTLTAALSSEKVLYRGDGEVFVSVELEAREAVATNRPPMNVAIVIDHSGSMQGEKIARAREAATGLVERLGPDDRAALVQYDDDAELMVPMTAADPAGRARLVQAIHTIQDAGGTNLGGGLTLGRDEILKNLKPERVNRVILLSDGNANIGITDIPSLARLSSDASEKGVRITTIGLGLDYNEDLMEKVADHGRGQYYYVRDAATLDTVFAGELKALQATVAKAAELRLEPACAGVEIAEVYGYPTRRDGQAVIVPLADLAGGDRRKVVARLKVPTGTAGTAKVLSAAFEFAAPAGGARQHVQALIGVEVSGDAARVTASAVPAVQAKVAQIESAASEREAAEVYAKGDQDGAVRIMSLGRVKLEAKRKMLPAKEMKVMEEDIAGLSNAFASTPASAPAAPAVTKAAKKAAYDAAK